MKKGQVVHKLYLDTKTDIPFIPAQISIYQPSIKEICLLNEANFLLAVNALTRDYIQEIKTEDNSDLTEYKNFDILMSIIKEKTDNSKRIFYSIFGLLELIFPNYNLQFSPVSILLQDKNDKNAEVKMIDKDSFDDFTDILYDMFALAELMGGAQQDYNPMGDRARALVEKFKKKRELLAQLKRQRGEDTENNSVFGRYINILAIGEHKDKNILTNYSVYQLIEEFKRFQLKETFDYTFQARMAGATNLKDAQDWMQEITLGVENVKE